MVFISFGAFFILFSIAIFWHIVHFSLSFFLCPKQIEKKRKIPVLKCNDTPSKRLSYRRGGRENRKSMSWLTYQDRAKTFFRWNDKIEKILLENFFSSRSLVWNLNNARLFFRLRMSFLCHRLYFQLFSNVKLLSGGFFILYLATLFFPAPHSCQSQFHPLSLSGRLGWPGVGRLKACLLGQFNRSGRPRKKFFSKTPREGSERDQWSHTWQWKLVSQLSRFFGRVSENFSWQFWLTAWWGVPQGGRVVVLSNRLISMGNFQVWHRVHVDS